MNSIYILFLIGILAFVLFSRFLIKNSTTRKKCHIMLLFLFAFFMLCSIHFIQVTTNNTSIEKLTPNELNTRQNLYIGDFVNPSTSLTIRSNITVNQGQTLWLSSYSTDTTNYKIDLCKINSTITNNGGTINIFCSTVLNGTIYNYDGGIINIFSYVNLYGGQIYNYYKIQMISIANSIPKLVLNPNSDFNNMNMSSGIFPASTSTISLLTSGHISSPTGGTTIQRVFYANMQIYANPANYTTSEASYKSALNTAVPPYFPVITLPSSSPTPSPTPSPSTPTPSPSTPTPSTPSPTPSTPSPSTPRPFALSAQIVSRPVYNYVQSPLYLKDLKTMYPDKITVVNNNDYIMINNGDGKISGSYIILDNSKTGLGTSFTINSGCTFNVSDLTISIPVINYGTITLSSGTATVDNVNLTNNTGGVININKGATLQMNQNIQIDNRGGGTINIYGILQSTSIRNSGKINLYSSTGGTMINVTITGRPAIQM